MSNPICCQCQIEMRVVQNGAVLIEMATFGPMALWASDVHQCPECKARVICQMGREPMLRGDPLELSPTIKAEFEAADADRERYGLYLWFLNARERQQYLDNQPRLLAEVEARCQDAS